MQVLVFGSKCVYCGGPHEVMDHFIPLALSGSGLASNLVPSCTRCNLSKGDSMPFCWSMKKFGAPGFVWVREHLDPPPMLERLFSPSWEMQ